MSGDQGVLRRVHRWLPRFAAGELRDRGLFRPPYEPGERFGVKLPHGSLQRLPAYAPDAAAAADRRQPATALVYATDRRVLLADGGKVAREWRLADLERLDVLPGLDGAVLLHSRTQSDADALVAVRHRGIDLFPDVYRARWLQLEACHALAHDRLEAWTASLAGRFAA